MYLRDRATALLVAYATGAALPMLAIAYGGQRVLARLRRLTPHAARLQRVFGVVVIATALAMYAGWDTELAARLATAFAGTDDSDASVLTDDGPAPELAGIDTWLNSDPLTMWSLRGKVVLVEFWTYSRVNCVRRCRTSSRGPSAIAMRGSSSSASTPRSFHTSARPPTSETRSRVTTFGTRSHRTTATQRGRHGTTTTGRRNISSTSVATWC
jgi:hypothetical protein